MTTYGERESLADAISDMSKSVNGSRYRFDWINMPIEELRLEFEGWERALQHSIEEDKIRQAQAKIAWDDRIVELIKLGARDRAAAIRWDMQAFNSHDVDEYLYSNGLPYTLESQVREELR